MKFWKPLLYAQCLGGNEILPLWLYHRGQLQRHAAWQSTHSVALVFYSFAIGTPDNRIFPCVVTGAFSFLTSYFMPSWAFSRTPIPECQTRDVFLSLNKTIWDFFGLRTGVDSWEAFWSRRKMTHFWTGMIGWEAWWSVFIFPSWERKKKGKKEKRKKCQHIRYTNGQQS